MKIALLHSHFDASHLDKVNQKMKSLGAPTIKAMAAPAYGDDCYVAFEGCHRLRAAHALGLEPIIDEIEYQDDMLLSDIVDDEDGHTVDGIIQEAAGAVWLEFRFYRPCRHHW